MKAALSMGKPRKRRAAAGVVAAGLLTCLAAARSFADGAQAPPPPPCVLVVKSGPLPQYEGPAETFAAAIQRPVHVIEIGPSVELSTRELEEARRRYRPRALFALGAPAAYLSRRVFPNTPLSFAMVLNWERYGLTAGPATGVEVDLPPAALFTRFKLLLPQLSRVGVIRSDNTDTARIEHAREAAAALGLELVEEFVAYPDEVAGAYRRIRTEIDALWMVPDATVVTVDNFRYLAARTRRDGVAFLAFSENFVRAGALLSVAPDYDTMGAQAAALLERLMADPALPPPVQAPLGGTLVVNGAVARDLDMKLDKATVMMADVIVGDAEGRP